MAQTTENMLGSLCFLKKDGTDGMEIPLTSEKCTIGSAGTIRIKSNDPSLRDIHCEIDVDKSGLASISNKAPLAPVLINGNKVVKCRYLKPGDVLDVMGKTWRYENPYLSEQILTKLSTSTIKPIFKTPMKSRLSLHQTIGKRKLSMTPDPQRTAPIIPRRKRSNSFTSANEFEVTEDSDPRNIEPFKTPGKRKSIRVRIGGTSEFTIDYLKTSELLPSKVISTPQRQQGVQVGTPGSVTRPARNETPRVLALKNFTKYSLAAQNPSPQPRALCTPTSDTSEEGATRDLRTPVTEQPDDLINFNTPLNNTSVVLIDSPDTDSAVVRSKKVKNMSMQRSAEDDDSIIILDSPDSKTPKSVMKVKHPLNITKTALTKSKMMSELLSVSTPARNSVITIDDNDSSEEDNEISRINDKEISTFSNYTEESVYESSSEELDASAVKDVLKTAQNSFSNPTPSKSATKTRKSTFLEESITADDDCFPNETPDDNDEINVTSSDIGTPINVTTCTINDTPSTSSKAATKQENTRKSLAFIEESFHELITPDYSDKDAEVCVEVKDSETPLKPPKETRQSLLFVEENLEDAASPIGKADKSLAEIDVSELKTPISAVDSLVLDKATDTFKTPDRNTPLLSKITMKQKRSTVKLPETETTPKGISPVTTVKSRRSLVSYESMSSNTSNTDSEDSAEEEFETTETTEETDECTEESEEAGHNAAPKRGVKRTRGSIMDDNSMVAKRAKYNVYTSSESSSFLDTSDVSSPFKSDNYLNESEKELSVLQENEDKLHNVLIDSPVVNIPLKKAVTEPRNKRERVLRRSLPPNTMANQENVPEDVFDCGDTTLESMDTSSFIYMAGEESPKKVLQASTSHLALEVNPEDDCTPAADLLEISDCASEDISLKMHSTAASSECFPVEESDGEETVAASQLSDVIEKELDKSEEIETSAAEIETSAAEIETSAAEIEIDWENTSKEGDTEDLSECEESLLKTPNSEKGSNDVSTLGDVKELSKTPKVQKSPKNDLSNVDGVKELLKTPKQQQKGPKNDLSNISGVKELMKTPRPQRGPKNDLSDVDGVKELLKTPKVQKGPKNDLSEVDGVKQLLQTPRPQRGPKNDLSDVDGVKELLKTPKVQKEPKNDLSEVDGVKELLKTPRPQRGPKNDLSEVDGVKELMKTPRTQRGPSTSAVKTPKTGVKEIPKTPKTQKGAQNDVANVSGVKETPKPQEGPKIDLSTAFGVRTPKSGVKDVLKTPKTQKDPQNDLENVSGVKKSPKESHKIDLSNVSEVKTPQKDISNDVKTPKLQKAPKNDLSNISVVKELLKTPKQQKIPKNDLSNVSGVKELMKTPKVQKIPKNDNSNLTGVKELMKTPKVQKVPENDLSSDIKELPQTPNPQRSCRSSKVSKEQNDPITTDSPTKAVSQEDVEKPPPNSADVIKTPKAVDEEDSEDRVEDLFLSPENIRETTAKNLNISGIDALEDFDLLLNKKPVRTYRGRSFSPKRTKEENHSRKTLGVAPDVSPNVQKWVDEHIAFPGDEDTSMDEEGANLASPRKSTRSAHKESMDNTVGVGASDEDLSPKKLRTTEIRIRIQNSDVDDASSDVFADYSAKPRNSLPTVSDLTTDSRTWRARKTLPTTFTVLSAQEETVTSPASKLEESIVDPSKDVEADVHTPIKAIPMAERSSSRRKLKKEETPAKMTPTSSSTRGKKSLPNTQEEDLDLVECSLEESAIEASIQKTPKNMLPSIANVSSKKKSKTPGNLDVSSPVEEESLNESNVVDQTRRKSRRNEENDMSFETKSKKVVETSAKGRQSSLTTLEVISSMEESSDQLQENDNTSSILSNEDDSPEYEELNCSINEENVDEITEISSQIKGRKSLHSVESSSSKRQSRHQVNDKSTPPKTNSSAEDVSHLEDGSQEGEGNEDHPDTPEKQMIAPKPASSKRKSKKQNIGADLVLASSAFEDNISSAEDSSVSTKKSKDDVDTDENINTQSVESSSSADSSAKTPDKPILFGDRASSRKKSKKDVETDENIKAQSVASSSAESSAQTPIKPILIAERASSRKKSKKDVEADENINAQSIASSSAESTVQTPAKPILITERASSRKKSKQDAKSDENINTQSVESSSEDSSVQTVKPILITERTSLRKKSKKDVESDENILTQSVETSSAEGNSVQTPVTPILIADRASSRKKSKKHVEETDENINTQSVESSAESSVQTPVEPILIPERASSRKKSKKDVESVENINAQSVKSSSAESSETPVKPIMIAERASSRKKSKKDAKSDETINLESIENSSAESSAKTPVKPILIADRASSRKKSKKDVESDENINAQSIESSAESSVQSPVKPILIAERASSRKKSKKDAKSDENINTQSIESSSADSSAKTPVKPILIADRASSRKKSKKDVKTDDNINAQSIESSSSKKKSKKIQESTNDFEDDTPISKRKTQKDTILDKTPAKASPKIERVSSRKKMKNIDNSEDSKEVENNVTPTVAASKSAKSSKRKLTEDNSMPSPKIAPKKLKRGPIFEAATKSPEIINKADEESDVDDEPLSLRASAKKQKQNLEQLPVDEEAAPIEAVRSSKRKQKELSPTKKISRSASKKQKIEDVSLADRSASARKLKQVATPLTVDGSAKKNKFENKSLTDEFMPMVSQSASKKQKIEDVSLADRSASARKQKQAATPLTVEGSAKKNKFEDKSLADEFTPMISKSVAQRSLTRKQKKLHTSPSIMDEQETPKIEEISASNISFQSTPIITQLVGSKSRKQGKLNAIIPEQDISSTSSKKRNKKEPPIVEEVKQQEDAEESIDTIGSSSKILEPAVPRGRPRKNKNQSVASKDVESTKTPESSRKQNSKNKIIEVIADDSGSNDETPVVSKALTRKRKGEATSSKNVEKSPLPKPIIAAKSTRRRNASKDLEIITILDTPEETKLTRSRRGRNQAIPKKLDKSPASNTKKIVVVTPQVPIEDATQALTSAKKLKQESPSKTLVKREETIVKPASRSLRSRRGKKTYSVDEDNEETEAVKEDEASVNIEAKSTKSVRSRRVAKPKSVETDQADHIDELETKKINKAETKIAKKDEAPEPELKKSARNKRAVKPKTVEDSSEIDSDLVESGQDNVVEQSDKVAKITRGKRKGKAAIEEIEEDNEIEQKPEPESKKKSVRSRKGAKDAVEQVVVEVAKKPIRRKRGAKDDDEEVIESKNKEMTENVPNKRAKVRFEEDEKDEKTESVKPEATKGRTRRKAPAKPQPKEEHKPESEEDSDSETTEVVKQVTLVKKTTRRVKQKSEDVEEITTIVKPGITTVVHKVTKGKVASKETTEAPQKANNKKKRIKSIADLEEAALTAEVHEQPKKTVRVYKLDTEQVVLDEPVIRKSARTRK